jgi:hypothetical protein
MPPVGFEPTIALGVAAVDLRLRPRGHWDRQKYILGGLNCIIWCLAVGMAKAEDVEVSCFVIRSCVPEFVRQSCRSHEDHQLGKQLCAAGELSRI